MSEKNRALLVNNYSTISIIYTFIDRENILFEPINSLYSSKLNKFLFSIVLRSGYYLSSMVYISNKIYYFYY